MLKEILIYISIFLGLFFSIFYFLSYWDWRKKRKPLKEIKFEELPTVSIIIPAYNEEKGIEKTIISASKIDYPNEKIEIIVVDDGSKDETFIRAKKYEGILNGRRVKVLKNPTNLGKGTALNLGIKNSKGKFIVTMDADGTIAKRDILLKTIRYFQNPNVMCVAPAMAIYSPKGFLQRIQQIEYMMGIFLRKAFASLNAIHITPGAFSVYRKSFFEKYGGFDKNNLTEDMEMAMRIQYHNYVIENDSDAIVYTVAPKKFVDLMKQRRRWYSGLLHNAWKYKSLFSRKYGILGVLIFPMAIISVFFTVFLTSYLISNTILELKKQIYLWQGVNYSFSGILSFSLFVLKVLILKLFLNPIFIFFSILILVLAVYIKYSKKRVKEYSVIVGFWLFVFFYSMLFVFWWIVAIIYKLFNRKISWR